MIPEYGYIRKSSGEVLERMRSKWNSNTAKGI